MLFNRRRTRTRSNPTPAPAGLQQLEPRLLLSADVLFAVNAGGPQVTGSDGVIWAKDKSSTDYPYNNAGAASSGNYATSTAVDITDLSVPAGTPQAIFQSIRHDSSRGENLRYSFPVTPGAYDVRLYFAEIDANVTAPGARVFDVTAEGQVRLDNYDPFAAASGGFRGVVETLRVNADSTLDIEFIRDPATGKNPQINAIQVLPVAASNQLSQQDVAIDFGSGVLVGSTPTRQVTLTNLGGAGDPSITLGAGSFTSGAAAGFAVEDLAGTVLAPGGSVTLDVAWTPSAAGSASAVYTIAHSGSNGPLTLNLTGAAVTQQVNNPPTVTPVTDKVVQAGSSLSIPVTASDPNGHPLALSASYGGGPLPAFMTFTDNGNGTGLLLVNPQAGDVETYSGVTITATEVGTTEAFSASTSFTVAVTAAPVTSDIVARINAGGKAIDDTVDWLTDSGTYNSDAMSGKGSTTATIDLVSHGSIPAGTPQKLLQTHRHDPSSGADLGFNLPVANGFYQVRLFFAEIDAASFVGSRLFNVDVEGVRVLDRYDVFAEAGLNVGVMKTFDVRVTDGQVDIDFSRDPETQKNPFVSGIELRRIERTPLAVEDNGLFPDALDFGAVQRPGSATKTLRLEHTGGAGDLTITGVTVEGASFGHGFSGPTTLQAGQTKLVDVTYTPGASGPEQGLLRISYTFGGQARTLELDLSGSGADSAPVGFGKSTLQGLPDLGSPTSLQFGPDDRLYVGYQNGTIGIYDVQRTAANAYTVTSSEIVTLARFIPNHNDAGQFVSGLNERLLTGILVQGTAANPVIYTMTSDPRGGSGGNADVDTNSGVLSRLTWNGAAWSKVDLVRGLPRSEEKHAGNGMQLDTATNTLYIAYGGNTNAGGPSGEFGNLPEYAYSAAILSVDLDAIDALPTQLDPVHGHAFKYNLPTLDDETRDFDGSGADHDHAAGIQDVFGGNNGKNQAILTPDGPVQVYAPGFRNPYDVLLHSSGRMYTVDNGANLGWGDAPVIDDNGTPGDPTDDFATNDPAEHGSISIEDMLHLVSGPGYYGGHPNPTRASTANTFNPTNPQSPVGAVGGNPVESHFEVPQTVAEGALATFTASTNGLTEYTADNFGGQMKGDLLTTSFFGGNTVWRLKLNAAGDAVTLKQALFTSVGTAPLDVTTGRNGGSLAGTIFVADYSQKSIIIFEPSDFDGGSGPGDPNDLDGDGYTNDDEVANGTDPNNAGDVPPDFDTDKTSDLLDDDDDNDTIIDKDDSFALDASNGSTTGTIRLNMDNLADGLFDLGFTGLMRDGQNDWLGLLDLDPAGTTGGAGEVLTLANVGSGTALGTVNTQKNALQFGVNPSLLPGEFSVRARVLSPFAGSTPQAGQQMGLYVGTGDQSNFVQLVIDGSGQVRLTGEVGDVTGATSSAAIALQNVQFVDLSISINQATGLATASYRASVGGVLGPAVAIPGSFQVPAAWLSGGSLAVGVLATSGGASPFTATWDFVEVTQDTARRLGLDVSAIDFGAAAPGSTETRTLRLTNLGAAGDPPITISALQLPTGPFTVTPPSPLPIVLAAGQSVDVQVAFAPTSQTTSSATLSILHDGVGGEAEVDLTGRGVVSQSSATLVVAPGTRDIKRSSTYSTESFQVANNSTDGVRITRLIIDASTTFLPDLVFDPFATAGDSAGRNLKKSTTFTDTTGYSNHTFELPLDGGFQQLTVNFADFDPGEVFIFGIDMDPTSVNGTVTPGPNHGGSISGLELTGARVTVEFSDGSTRTNRLWREPGTNHASRAELRNGVPTSPVSIDVPAVDLAALPSGATGALVASPQQTVRVTGTPGQAVRLLGLDAGLYTENGGFDIDLLEANSVAKFAEYSATIGAGGFVDIAVTLTQRQETGWEQVTGYNHFIATVVDAQGITGGVSNVVVLKYDQSPAFDFGDASGGGTTLAQNGARHLVPSGPSDPAFARLGAALDTEADGTPTADASGDDAVGDDEDGLVGFSATSGGAGQLTVNVVGGAGFLSAWVDANGDGDFTDAGERIASAVSVAAGQNVVAFTAPAVAAGEATLRLRLSPTADPIDPTGLVIGGEVEDHRVTFAASQPLVATVESVRVASSTWSESFITAIDPAAQQGYLLTDNPDTPYTLPWDGIDRVLVTFSQDIGGIDASDIRLTGVAGGEAAVLDVAYDAASRTATVMLAAPLASDRLLIEVGSGDATATALAEGEAGGLAAGVEVEPFTLEANVLPGDVVDGATAAVTASDVAYVRNKQFTLVGSPAYDPLADIDGSGAITAADVALVRNYQFTVLPPEDEGTTA